MSDDDNTPTFNELLTARRPDNGAADLARRAIENAKRLQAEEDARAEAEEKAQAEAEAARGGFNRLLRGPAEAHSEPEPPREPAVQTGSADYDTDGEEGAVYEQVLTDAGWERMRVYDL